MGHTHTAIAAEASTQPVVATANNDATLAVANATGANSLATQQQEIVANANIANTGEVSVQTVSDCCQPHVELGLAGVTSQEAHSYLMNLYERNACDRSYLQELYDKCSPAHQKAVDEPSYLNELYVEDCHAEHIATQCTTTPQTPVVEPTPVIEPSYLQQLYIKGEDSMMTETATPTVVVTDSATKCPAAVSVCTATGDASAECTAAKEQCVADLAAKKITTGEVRVHRDRNIVTNPEQAALKAERTSRRHSY